MCDPVAANPDNPIPVAQQGNPSAILTGDPSASQKVVQWHATPGHPERFEAIAIYGCADP
jgi:hypothetical protein